MDDLSRVLVVHFPSFILVNPRIRPGIASATSYSKVRQHSLKFIFPFCITAQLIPQQAKLLGVQRLGPDVRDHLVR